MNISCLRLLGTALGCTLGPIATMHALHFAAAGALALAAARQCRRANAGQSQLPRVGAAHSAHSAAAMARVGARADQESKAAGSLPRSLR
jgi:hypothetical protein